MSRNFTEKELKKAVSLAWHHEFNREGNDISSHSQIERWIIQELKKCSRPCEYYSLETTMIHLFEIYMDTTPRGDIDLNVSGVARHYRQWSIVPIDTGGGCTALSREFGNGCSILITLIGGAKAPEYMTQAICVDVGNMHGNNVDYKEFENSDQLTDSDWFKWIIATQ